MELILASKNAHKAKEMQAILGEDFVLVTQDEAGFGGVDVIEDGETFSENAIKKAVTLMNASQKAAIADDSGLVVDALSGRPGVFTARFAGEGATDEENIKKLLLEMKDVEWEKRTARFVCAIAVSIPGEEVKSYCGECEGYILEEKHGDNGFGYDPVFFVPKYQKSMAELDGEIKNSISHRFNALDKMKSDMAL